MGLFSRNQVVEALTAEDLKQIKVKALATFALADVFDTEVLQPEKPEEGLRAGLTNDLAYFMICLAEVDGVLGDKELELMNEILGTAIDAQACKEIVAGRDTQRCTRTVPQSFAVLEKNKACCIAKTIAVSAIDLYEMLGMAVASADGTLEKEEAWEVNGFVAMLKKAIRWE